MNKTILTYSLISGTIGALFMLINGLFLKNSMDLNNSQLIGYTGILLSMLFVFLGTRAYRDHSAGGVLSFGEAFKVSILITVISCAFYVVTWMIIFHTMMPDFMDRFAEQMLAQLRSSGASETEIQQTAAKMEEYKVMYQNPFIRVALTFLEPFPIGLLVSLVSSLVLRTKKHQAAA